MPVSARLALKIMLVALAVSVGSQASAAGDAGRGKELAYTCLGCHGIENYKNVYPTYSVPELGGQHASYIVAALKEYRSGERSHATMHEQAQSLSDQDIEDIAAYFAGTELKAGTSLNGTPPQKVQQLCVACHGINGIGVTSDYPDLAGQQADYIARALREYKQGDRKNAVMPTFVAGLKDDEIDEIAKYYSQQRPPLEVVHRRVSIFESK
ncbi:MAG TPA: cytochrome c [Steroidobacteraceae bacterium]|jgi:cytochrome c553|nr:cytochrome c [Steroidobacteraceae bacterium]